MGANGLQSSRWASKDNDGYFRRAGGTWTCYFCGASNPLSKSACSECQPPTTVNGGHATKPPLGKSNLPNAFPPSSITSKKATQENGIESPGSVSSPSQTNRGGLSMSRWAPRNINAQNPREVWTRTAPAPTFISANGYSTSRSPPDLGLPYQVQHYILGTIQRILEEGCYDFAARWIPQTLHRKGWDCAEAVELSNWKSFLPTAVPLHAIKPLSNYSLDAALGNAVRTRNAAVHRHLCDTEEIRKMALHSRDLMLMFSDVSRQSKFHLLWEELGQWERQGRTEPQVARTRLEEALKEISERPIDDMDWTPNAVSLQEISENKNSEAEEPFDEMELD